MAKTTKHALELLATPSLAVAKQELVRLQAATIAELANIAHREAETGMRAIMVGIALHRIKLSLKHGEWMPWLEANVRVKKSSVNNYMRLALVFLEKTKVAKPDLLSLPGDQTSLDLGDKHEAKRFMAKLGGFVGELSLTELLIKHGIKGVGLKTDLTTDDDGEGDGELTPAQRAKLAAEQAWLEAWNSAQLIRQSLTEPDKVALLNDAKQVEQLKSEVVEINKLLDDRLAELRAAKI